MIDPLVTSLLFDMTQGRDEATLPSASSLSNVLQGSPGPCGTLPISLRVVQMHHGALALMFRRSPTSTGGAK
jgi:hypothetical protein